MWLDAQVYEEQLPMVKIGQKVEATVGAVPGKTFKGRISFTCFRCGARLMEDPTAGSSLFSGICSRSQKRTENEQW